MLINREKQRLGELLKDINLLTDEQVEQALLLQKKEGIKFGDAVVRLGFLKKDDINWALSNQLNIPYISDLTEKSVYDPASVWLLPYEFAKQHRVIVLGQVLDAVNVVIADPLNKEALEQIERITGKYVNVSIGDEQVILDMIETFYKGKKNLTSIDQDMDQNISQIRKHIENILNDIGAGFDINVYKNAICTALKANTQKDMVLPLIYRGSEIGTYKIDIIIDNIIAILFSNEQNNLPDAHSLLRLTGLKGIILIRINNNQLNLEAVG
ncbi:MAG: GxxExxY protein [bacterium]